MSCLRKVLERANNVKYGLCATVWSSDVNRVHRVARKLQVSARCDVIITSLAHTWAIELRSNNIVRFVFLNFVILRRQRSFYTNAERCSLYC